MLREYAVEPSLLGTFADARYFLEKFGVERGRLIADYPGGWPMSVLTALQARPVEVQRVEIWLDNLRHAIVRRPRSTYTSERPWLEQAIEEDARERGREFDFILSDGVERTPKVLDGRKVDEDDANWAAPTDKIIARTPAEMAKVVRPLLRIAKRIRFVDPYFDGSLPKRAPMLEFVRAAVAGNRHGSAPRIEIHSALQQRPRGLGDPPRAAPSLHAMQQDLQRGVEVHYSQWWQRPCGEQFHNRYVLTDVGGIDFGAGLDAHPGATDTVGRLSRAVSQALWARLDDGSALFEREVVHLRLYRP